MEDTLISLDLFPIILEYCDIKYNKMDDSLISLDLCSMILEYF